MSRLLGASRRRASGIPYADRALLWSSTDDASASLGEGDTSYLFLPNRGTLGSLTSSIGQPARSLVTTAGRGPQYSANPSTGGFTYGTAATFAALHNQSGAGTVVVALRVTSSANNPVIFATSTSAAQVGVMVRVQGGFLRVSFGSGSSSISDMTDTIAFPGGSDLITLAFRKTATYASGGTVTWVNGVQRLSATLSGLSSITASQALSVGSQATYYGVTGYLHEFAVYGDYLTDFELGSVERYLRQRWA